MNKTGPYRGDDLGKEHGTLGYLEIMTELQVAEEGMGLIHGDVTICLEEHHRDWPSRLHVSDDVFSEDVQAEVNIGCCVNDTNGYRPDNRDQETYDKRPPRQVGGPTTNGCEAEAYHHKKQGSIPPSRNGLVFTHHLCVVIIQ